MAKKKRKKKVVKKEIIKKNRRMKKPYQLIITRNNKQVECLSQYTTEIAAYKKFMLLLEENKNVIFPKQYHNDKEISESQYELVMIKRRDEDDPHVTLVKNSYGSYVEHESSSANWMILDRAIYEKEETFWVYGYHPLTQRKDFTFIFNELVKPKVIDKYSFLNIYIYKNKVLFETYDNLDMVICKNIHDAIRLYNLLEVWCQDHKFRYVLFSGDGNMSMSKRRDCCEKIAKLTNWNIKKITRSTTNPS